MTREDKLVAASAAALAVFGVGALVVGLAVGTSKPSLTSGACQ